MQEEEDPAAESPDPGSAKQWGYGIEAQRLQSVNKWSKDLEIYLQTIVSITGIPHLTVTNLRQMVDSAQKVLGMRIGRTEQRGKWALLAFMKRAFPTPYDFVNAAIDADMTFVRNRQGVRLLDPESEVDTEDEQQARPAPFQFVRVVEKEEEE